MISIKKLNKKFDKLEVLKNLDLEISRGGIHAILGPNGSGKTTLIKCILGMVIPNSGTIEYKGKSIINKWDYRKDILYLPQIANFPPNLTVKEIIDIVKNVRGTQAEEQELIETLGLQSFMKKKLSHLSGGTKQKVNIVLTFMFDGDLIILDEPTSGLDPVSLIKLKQIIQQQKDKGKTIFVTSHIMSFVEEIADNVVFLLDGNIHFKGTISQLKDTTGTDSLEHSIAQLLIQENA
ncbi:MAG: ABC transporter ATP-binding protein [Chitinophagales bacterium]|nr:ABC transporter ATP-binding protein [Chitinophagales bacterium]